MKDKTLTIVIIIIVGLIGLCLFLGLQLIIQDFRLDYYKTQTASFCNLANTQMEILNKNVYSRMGYNQNKIDCNLITLP